MKFKKKALFDSMRIFSLLLHKCWLVSRRRWFVSLFGEILLPISLIYCGWAIYEGMSNGSHKNETTHCQSQSLDELIDQIGIHRFPFKLAYTPTNPFTDQLMAMVNQCLKNKANVISAKTESELIFEYMSEINGKTFVAIIFDESTDDKIKHLHYKLRWKYGNIDIYDTDYWYTINLYSDAYIAQIQFCLDLSYVLIASKNTTINIPEVSIQHVPDPAYNQCESISYIILVIVAFVITSSIETVKATKEKYAGINILMSMNGISNILNSLSWIISGMLLLSLTCIAIIVLNIVGVDGNFNTCLGIGNSVIFVILVCHLAHELTFGMHVSAYFSKSLHLIYTLIVIKVMGIILYGSTFFLISVDLEIYLGLIFPMILLHQAIKEINTHERIGQGIGWSNIFVSSNPQEKFVGTVGMILILYVIGTILHFLLAVYVYTINPGMVGIGKHPLFFLKSRYEEEDDGNSVENLIYDDVNDKYFEPNSTRYNIPGIQIRNLKKSYDVGLFNREKVHALQGVSVDFYKGQITSLLGHNGAGKSTLMAVLAGLINPTDGLILIGSKNMKNNAPEILKDVGFFAQKDVYFLNLTVTEQLEFFAMIKMSDKSRFASRENVKTLIQKLKLVDVKDFLPNKLSEDQKRKLCLGMAFVGNPSTLILDEPTSRMDHENKHLIWDILLEMRGQKTILISTHDMEEADILGDRIAIMHEGRLKSYGTSLYLKKMIAGQYNIDVTLVVERWSDPDRIRAELDNEANIIDRQDKKMIVSVPISAMLASSLDNLDRKKKDLGICSYSLAHIGLEQVFVKVAEDNGGHRPNQCNIVTSGKEKLKGFAGYLQSMRGLFVKNIKCALKNSGIIKMHFLTLFTNLLAISIYLTWEDDLSYSDLKTHLIQLDKYVDPYTFYKSSDRVIANVFESISNDFGARSIEMTDKNLNDALLRLANEDPLHYHNHLITAVEFHRTGNKSIIANAFYSDIISYSLPISLNLIGNTILKNLIGPEYLISLSSQSLPSVVEFKRISETATLGRCIITIILVSLFHFTIGMFLSRPCRERSGGLKHLQKTTGVSGLTYWATMFLVDMMHYMCLIVMLIIGLVCMDFSLGLQMYGIQEILIMMMLLTLLATNVLPLAYICSFMKIKISTIVQLLTFIPFGIDVLLWIWKSYQLNQDTYFILRHLFIPYASFFNEQMEFQTTMTLNGVCRRLPDHFMEFQCRYSDGFCCKQILHEGDNCSGRKCEKLLPYSFDASFIYLWAMPFFYFGILTLLEAELLQTFFSKCSRILFSENCFDEKILLGKSNVFKKIQERILDKNVEQRTEDLPKDPIFLAYKLRKHYWKVKAVEDVSFHVNEGECFGLFGVNRSGKSTILKMIIGQAIPNCGVMYIDDNDFENNQKFFLSQIGYCPQQDVSLKYLNSYDHLRLFARLRGIPENQIEDEIHAWIEKLDLVACASHPSGTYSSGNKQRLNIAMALIGNPKLVLLDEPTTRMDPGARRSFWHTIKSLQLAGQTFLLASNKMEECEALCNRMTVMVDGKLIYIGTPEELKQRFGCGYDVQIRISPMTTKKQIIKIKKDLRLLLPCVLNNENSSFLMYYVMGTGTTWRKIYEVMNRIKQKYDCVDDFLVVVRLST